jgi:hypothetical protein
MLSGLHAPVTRALFMYLVSRPYQRRHEQMLWGQDLFQGAIHCSVLALVAVSYWLALPCCRMLLRMLAPPSRSWKVTSVLPIYAFFQIRVIIIVADCLMFIEHDMYSWCFSTSIFCMKGLWRSNFEIVDSGLCFTLLGVMWHSLIEWVWQGCCPSTSVQSGHLHSFEFQRKLVPWLHLVHKSILSWLPVPMEGKLSSLFCFSSCL